jgi:uncharacterized protein (DUF1778 family)
MKTLTEAPTTPGLGRLQMRISQERRDLLARAAALTGRTLTEFVLDSAEQAALRTIEERQVLQLTQQDTDFLVATLLNPPEPGPHLRQAARDYLEQME